MVTKKRIHLNKRQLAEHNMNELEDFNLPEPDTRLVVFGKTVFKIKYKTSDTLLPTEEAACKTPWFHDELKKITKATLTHVKRSGRAVPLRSDHLAVYPGFHLWESVGDLQFSRNEEVLQAHPNVILLLVKLLAPDKGGMSTPPMKQTREHLGRKRTLPPDDEHLPPKSMPSSYHLARKRLRPESWPPVVPLAGCGAALPTGTRTDDPVAVVKDENPSAEAVALCATETMRSLDRLSQPTQLKVSDMDVQRWFSPWKIIRSVFQPLMDTLQSKS